MFDTILADRELVTLQLKFGTMFIVSRLLAGGNLFNVEWMLEVIYSLLGLVTYSLIIKKFIPKDVSNITLKDIIKYNAIYGSMLIVNRLLSGKPFNNNYFSSVIYILLGITFYHAIIKDFVKLDRFKDKKIQGSINDSLEILTMSIVSQFLAGKSYDNKWFYSTLYTCSGFVVYHLVTSSILK